ncbi:hypothetical protein ACO0K9_00875 [Undibacterium sp. Ji50W]|uniref:hypothetical protein n=1 Tax=Undibacterium sp. Ji50W TaxID=3413041 RepID=UPI003BF218AD
MKASILKMRKAGIELPKRVLFDRFNSPRPGDLVIGESSDQGLHRMCMRAHFQRDGSPVDGEYLFDCRILWMHEERMMLAGFEKFKTEQGEVCYAQSWLCLFGDVPPIPEGG